MLLEIYAGDFTELGAKVSRTAGTRRGPAAQQRRTKDSPASFDNLSTWRPEGTLVAHLAEHEGPINCVRIAADNAFFVTCSDDKTVKVWDTQRLEKNVTNRARLTYKGHGMPHHVEPSKPLSELIHIRWESAGCSVL